MPFKIVQTIERGKAMLTAVPDKWESNGVLYWPRKNFEKSRKNENSEPDANCSPKNCILKRSNIISLQKAESLIDIMCENSDTETEHDVSQKQNNYKKATQNNFNEMAEQCTQITDKTSQSDDTVSEIRNEEAVEFSTEDSSLPVSIAIPEQQEDSSLPVSIAIPEQQPSHIIIQQVEDSPTKLDEISETLKTITETLTTLSQNQQVIFKSQKVILSKISEIQTEFEEVVKQFGTKHEINNLIVDLKPISKLEELQTFENLILTNNQEAATNLKNQLSVACKKGKGQGYNNAYVLIDILFERNFLKECSWAGGSKSDQTKICFKAFTNTIKFFFNIIHDFDEDFSLVDCHKFFKIILRNARQRAGNKQSRLSSKKNRAKKLKTVQTQKPENTQNQQNQLQQSSSQPQSSLSQPQPAIEAVALNSARDLS